MHPPSQTSLHCPNPFQLFIHLLTHATDVILFANTLLLSVYLFILQFIYFLFLLSELGLNMKQAKSIAKLVGGTNALTFN